MDKNGVNQGVVPLTAVQQSKDDSVISVAAVVELVGDLCPSCQAIIRQKIAANAYRIVDTSGKNRIQRIIARVAIKFGINPDEIVNGGNVRELVRARKQVALECRDLGYSFPQIASALKRHHSTIMYLVKECKF